VAAEQGDVSLGERMSTSGQAITIIELLRKILRELVLARKAREGRK
jgi:hypothetical protein